MTLELARRTGPGGQVTGIDMDEIKLAIARDEARKASISNVHHLRAGLDDLDEHSVFDVAYARFLLAHLPDPAKAVRTLVRAARPGGVVAVEDVDFAGCYSHPANGAYATPRASAWRTRCCSSSAGTPARPASVITRPGAPTGLPSQPARRWSASCASISLPARPRTRPTGRWRTSWRLTPEQGWSLLCNGTVLFEDTGALLPDGQSIPPHRAAITNVPAPPALAVAVRLTARQAAS